MKKHLENLMIHRFRGLQELELSGLGRINLLVGANNSGKTSVPEAVSTYCRPLDPLEWLNTAWRREMTSSRAHAGRPEMVISANESSALNQSDKKC
ncbi:hypothetical protein QUF72_10640 [Desulfobacterales bacterium HSG2]|nr:hypothetical protein [Desulfobacterales bacterium HSG2]